MIFTLLWNSVRECRLGNQFICGERRLIMCVRCLLPI